MIQTHALLRAVAANHCDDFSAGTWEAFSICNPQHSDNCRNSTAGQLLTDFVPPYQRLFTVILLMRSSLEFLCHSGLSYLTLLLFLIPPSVLRFLSQFKVTTQTPDQGRGSLQPRQSVKVDQMLACFVVSFGQLPIIGHYVRSFDTGPLRFFMDIYQYSFYPKSQ